MEDVTGEGVNARTRVHEYGGGSYALGGDALFFSNYADQRLYRQDPGQATPRPITPEPPAPAAHRYADACPTPDGRLLVCVRERHHDGEVVNELVAVPADGGGEPVVLAAGPRLLRQPPGQPRRPPAGLAGVGPPEHALGRDRAAAGRAGRRRPGRRPGHRGRRAGGVGGPARVEPRRRPAPGQRPHRLVEPVPGGRRRVGRALEALAPAEEEFGAPHWVFGMSTYAFLPGGRIACIHGRGPMQRLGVLEPDGALTDLELPFTSFYPPHLRAYGDRLACIAGSPTDAPAVVVIDPADGGVQVLRSSEDEALDPGYLSVPEPIEFPTEGGRTAHALYYPPANRDFQGPAGERPPLVVASHGGPTSGVVSDLHVSYQFFTSRGIAVVDVDYGGSTGYGRAYRRRLDGRWGIVDVDDCVAAARYLAGRGDVDPARLAIRGGSAGGYTTLCALTFRDDFAAGASYYGVADVAALARDTHKFEARYLDRLIGPWPEAEPLYRERSPIHHTDRLSCPVILLQGLEDEVVPPAQAETMAAALDAKGIPHAYLPFPGEQHGLRQAAHIRRALEAELYFYSRVFGFDLADPVEPVRIAHL